MTTKQLTILNTDDTHDFASLTTDASADKNVVSRINAYNAWLLQGQRDFLKPNLADYKEALEARGLKDTSIHAHLATIKSAYRRLLDNREYLYSQLPDQTMSFADKKALVDELALRIEQSNKSVSVKLTTVQDSDHTWLTSKEAVALISIPGQYDHAGLRDTAVLTLLLTTGLREAELADLTLDDITRGRDGKAGIWVMQGKGKKQRFVYLPTGMQAVLELVKRYAAYSDNEAGLLFDITPRTIQRIVSKHSRNKVTPHDLRRTYARLSYLAGMRVEEIQKNMGHTSPAITWEYIGDVDTDNRQPPALFDISFLAA